MTVPIGPPPAPPMRMTTRKLIETLIRLAKGMLTALQQWLDAQNQIQ